MKIAKGFFVTGTDTNIGKTIISSALLFLLKNWGLKTLALKPISTGAYPTENGLRHEDLVLLQQFATEQLDYSLLNPFIFQEPIAPHIAAAKQGQQLTVAGIIQKCNLAFHTTADYVIIEGVGGWLVPLNVEETISDLAKNLGYPIILVVGLRLGCLNHCILTIQNMISTATQLCGWVANIIEPNMLYVEENLEMLKQHISAPLLGVIPYQENIDVNFVAEQLSGGLKQVL